MFLVEFFEVWSFFLSIFYRLLERVGFYLDLIKFNLDLDLVLLESGFLFFLGDLTVFIVLLLIKY